jgi:hypothetical protein
MFTESRNEDSPVNKITNLNRPDRLAVNRSGQEERALPSVATVLGGSVLSALIGRGRLVERVDRRPDAVRGREGRGRKEGRSGVVGGRGRREGVGFHRASGRRSMMWVMG